ncbi:MAG: hypothetical protein Q9181_007783 [Wetmoreana brouardii]
MAAFDMNFEDYDSIGDDANSMLEDFADILGIRDEVYHYNPRMDSHDSFGYSHVGKSDPRVKNLGDSWVMDHTSVTVLVPVNQAANRLTAFYNQVVDNVVRQLRPAMAPSRSLRFTSHGLSLTLTSVAPIHWSWAIRFAREMARSSDSGWTVLYEARIRNAYWNVAIIHAALRLAK